LNIYFTLALCLFIACEDNENPTTQCTDFKEGIINDNEDLVRGAIDDWCSDLMPNPAPGDEIGHQENLNTLVQRIADECDVATGIYCYACMESYPPQSAIIITFVEDNVTYSKSINISTPYENVLSFVAMN